MKRDCILGLDLGTTTVKAVVVDQGDQVAATGRATVKVSTPRPGWVTQEPTHYRQAVFHALREATQQISTSRLAGIALSGAMHSLLPIDADDQPLAQAMLWADGRGQPQAKTLRGELDTHAMHRRTGCPVRAQYHPSRLRWWHEEGDLPRAPALWVGLKDWITHSLTGRWCCDTGLASCTGLLNLRARQWDDEALAAARINPHHLPELLPSREAAGKITADAASQTGLPEGLPLILGSSDGALANLGAAGGCENQIVMSVGTSGAVRLTTSTPQVDDHEATWCYLLADNLFVRGGAINNGGLSVQWVADRCFAHLPADQRYDRLDHDAAQVPPGCDGVTLLPYFTGERTPLWNAQAAASIHGLTLSHGPAHLGRAAMEAVAFCLADVWDAMGITPSEHPEARLTGGITRSPLWRQIVADVLGVRLQVWEAADASPIGAARLGRWALGLTSNLSDFQPPQHDVTVEPDSHIAHAYAAARNRFEQLKPRRS